MPTSTSTLNVRKTVGGLRWMVTSKDARGIIGYGETELAALRQFSELLRDRLLGL
jgi:hypothetical protein